MVRKVGLLDFYREQQLLKGNRGILGRSICKQISLRLCPCADNLRLHSNRLLTFVWFPLWEEKLPKLANISILPHLAVTIVND